MAGIIASGTILRGNPGPSSDLDIYVIHTQPIRQRVQKYFNGVPAEIFVNPVASILRYFEEEGREGRPITAHMLATGHVILSRDPVVGRIRDKAQKLLKAGYQADEAYLTQVRYLSATRFEDGLDVVKDDPATALMFFNQAVPEMLAYYFRKSGQPIPRAKELLACLDQHNPVLAGLAREFYHASDLDRRVELAKQIADQTIQTRGFFEWESAIEDV